VQPSLSEMTAKKRVQRRRGGSLRDRDKGRSGLLPLGVQTVGGEGMTAKTNLGAGGSSLTVLLICNETGKNGV